ncbi:MAG: dephospho-CoA kinase [Gammaproteobacteria bacterium RIFCSPHIGHO2_12_FULL_45_9]|nr:MAG: dephospho-CoA kinase [Gammaproteobacteria bacterium RIFCSPHIGHO2_12_FULL_45_9]
MVAQCFVTLGIPVLSADRYVAALLEQNSPVFDAIVTHFKPLLGQEPIVLAGELNKSGIRHIILQSVADRLWLEQLLHPLVLASLHRETQALQNVPYCVWEIPLLGKSGLRQSAKGMHYIDHIAIDRIILVDTPDDVRIQRIMMRDQVPAQAAEAMLQVQDQRTWLLQQADDVIEGTLAPEALQAKVRMLDEAYRVAFSEKT